jgi:hypothetical protein
MLENLMREFFFEVAFQFEAQLNSYAESLAIR